MAGIVELDSAASEVLLLLFQGMLENVSSSMTAIVGGVLLWLSPQPNPKFECLGLYGRE